MVVRVLLAAAVATTPECKRIAESWRQTRRAAQMPFVEFVHVARAGGNAVEDFLRHSFHGPAALPSAALPYSCNASPGPGERTDCRWYRAGHASVDRRVANPRDYSLSHRRIVWITVLREPLSRLVSSYNAVLQFYSRPRVCRPSTTHSLCNPARPRFCTPGTGFQPGDRVPNTGQVPCQPVATMRHWVETGGHERRFSLQAELLRNASSRKSASQVLGARGFDVVGALSAPDSVDAFLARVAYVTQPPHSRFALDHAAVCAAARINGSAAAVGGSKCMLSVENCRRLEATLVREDELPADVVALARKRHAADYALYAQAVELDRQERECFARVASMADETPTAAVTEADGSPGCDADDACCVDAFSNESSRADRAVPHEACKRIGTGVTLPFQCDPRAGPTGLGMRTGCERRLWALIEGRIIAFVGDSLSRQHYQLLSCTARRYARGWGAANSTTAAEPYNVSMGRVTPPPHAAARQLSSSNAAPPSPISLYECEVFGDGTTLCYISAARANLLALTAAQVIGSVLPWADVVVANIGIHVAARADLQAQLSALLGEVGAWRRRQRGAPDTEVPQPVVLWRETLPQHFPTVEYDPTRLLRNACMPIGDSTRQDAKFNFRNALANRLVGASAAHVRILRVWDALLPMHSAHIKPGVDCTHYCLDGAADVLNLRLMHALDELEQSHQLRPRGALGRVHGEAHERIGMLARLQLCLCNLTNVLNAGLNPSLPARPPWSSLPSSPYGSLERACTVLQESDPAGEAQRDVAKRLRRRGLPVPNVRLDKLHGIEPCMPRMRNIVSR